jgi:hypothetical protein
MVQHTAQESSVKVSTRRGDRGVTRVERSTEPRLPTTLQALRRGTQANGVATTCRVDVHVGKRMRYVCVCVCARVENVTKVWVADTHLHICMAGTTPAWGGW